MFSRNLNSIQCSWKDITYELSQYFCKSEPRLVNRNFFSIKYHYRSFIIKTRNHPGEQPQINYAHFLRWTSSNRIRPKNVFRRDHTTVHCYNARWCWCRRRRSTEGGRRRRFQHHHHFKVRWLSLFEQFTQHNAQFAQSQFAIEHVEQHSRGRNQSIVVVIVQPHSASAQGAVERKHCDKRKTLSTTVHLQQIDNDQRKVSKFLATSRRTIVTSWNDIFDCPTEACASICALYIGTIGKWRCRQSVRPSTDGTVVIVV